jgi:hypothetical protein
MSPPLDTDLSDNNNIMITMRLFLKRLLDLESKLFKITHTEVRFVRVVNQFGATEGVNVLLLKSLVTRAWTSQSLSR